MTSVATDLSVDADLSLSCLFTNLLSFDFLPTGVPYILAGLYFLGAAAGVGLGGSGRLTPAKTKMISNQIN